MNGAKVGVIKIQNLGILSYLKKKTNFMWGMFQVMTLKLI